MASDGKPRAKQGLLASDHSKRGQRFVTVLDSAEKRVTLLAPWEHAILVLCDGTRTPSDIAELLRDGIEDEPVTAGGVARCLRFFEREGLMESVPKALPPAGPKTMANLQLAYREWHKDPEKSGRLLSGLLSPPFLDDPPPFRQSLAPTVALPDPSDGEKRKPTPAPAPMGVGSTLVVDGPAGSNGRVLRSVLEDQAPVDVSVSDEDLTNVAELLAAVDFDLAEDAENVEAIVAPLSPTDLGVALSSAGRSGVITGGSASEDPVEPARSVGRATGGIADLPSVQAEAETSAKARRVVGRSDTPVEAWPIPEGFDDTEDPEVTRRFRHRQLSEAALTPTLVGHAPPDGHGAPVIVVPQRASENEGQTSNFDGDATVEDGAARPDLIDAAADTDTPDGPQPAAPDSIEDTLPVRSASPVESPAE